MNASSPPPSSPDPLDPSPADAALIDALRRSQTLEDAPEALISRVIGLFPAAAAPSPAAAPPSRAGWASALRELLVALVQDTGFQAAPALGLRAGGALRHIAGHAEAFDIEIGIGPAADGAQGWMLSGQILGPEASGHLNLRIEGQAAGWTAALSEMGEFRMGPIPDGRWKLSLHLGGELVLVMPPIDVPG